MNKVATKESWKNMPTDLPKKIEINLHFTDEQFAKLIQGLIPQQMEDKWFIYYEDEWLYFHRSWTGHGIYKAKLNKVKNGYSINEFWVETNQEIYLGQDPAADINNFTFLIAAGLLNIDAREIYANNNIKTDEDVLSSWSKFGKMNLKKDKK